MDTVTAITTKLKEDFYRQIQLVPDSGDLSQMSISFLTEEEILSLAKAWVDLVLWKQNQIT